MVALTSIVVSTPKPFAARPCHMRDGVAERHLYRLAEVVTHYLRWVARTPMPPEPGSSDETQFTARSRNRYRHPPHAALIQSKDRARWRSTFATNRRTRSDDQKPRTCRTPEVRRRLRRVHARRLGRPRRHRQYRQRRLRGRDLAGQSEIQRGGGPPLLSQLPANFRAFPISASS